MAWVTISLRKMVLKQRISMLEARLIELSQQQQSLANNSNYSQQAMNAMKDMHYGQLQVDNQGAINTMMQNVPGEGASAQDSLDFNNSLNNLNLANMQERMRLDSIFENEENNMRSEVDRKARALEAEQVQIETQLKAARAEEESLGKAMDQDIKNGAIQLA